MSPIYIHSCLVYGRRKKMKRQNKKISKEEEERPTIKKIKMRSIIHGRRRLSTLLFLVAISFPKDQDSSLAILLFSLWSMGHVRFAGISHSTTNKPLSPHLSLNSPYIPLNLPAGLRATCVLHMRRNIMCIYMYVHMSTTQFNIAFPLSRLLLLLLRHSSFAGGLALVVYVYTLATRDAMGFTVSRCANSASGYPEYLFSFSPKSADCVMQPRRGIYGF